MSSTAITFKSKSEAEQFAANGNGRVIQVADVHAVVISDHKTRPADYFVWSNAVRDNDHG